ncbi:cupin domain-containing protein [Halopenitus persicus]|uniref:cupin domain-containing protein n=1 Tax=Halopenitus persicus TaxID=1048396 RepID=UPI000BBB31CB|nr:cupin domain-containing protein [Halopenitus persicus]
MEIVTDADVEATEAADGVHLTQEAAGEHTSVQGFTIEPGATVPEHRHDHEQAGVVTAGTLTFLIAGEERPVSAGESYVIPGDEPHAAVNRGDVPVEGYDVFSPPRLDPDWLAE